MNSPATAPADRGSAATAAAGTTSLALQAVLAALLGATLLAAAGFVQIEAVHNAAHDVRHANGFPCH
jgi:cobalt transporter subunit CbtB